MSVQDSTSVEEKVKQIVCKVLHKQDYDPTSTFADLEADSLDIVQILVAIEEEYNIEIMDDDLQEITDMQKFVDYIKRKIDEKK